MHSHWQFSLGLYEHLQLLGLVTMFLLPNTILVLKPMAKVLVFHDREAYIG